MPHIILMFYLFLFLDTVFNFIKKLIFDPELWLQLDAIWSVKEYFQSMNNRLNDTKKRLKIQIEIIYMLSQETNSSINAIINWDDIL